MLTGINFKNYKAFEEGHLEIKPITILLGANSVGKSSLIQLFLMLQETANAYNYKSALKLNGGFFSLGEGINLFRKKDIDNPLNFEIEFRDSAISGIIRREFFERFFEETIDFCYFILRNVPNNEDGLKFFEDKFVRNKHNKPVRDVNFLASGRYNFLELTREDILKLLKIANGILKKIEQSDNGKKIANSMFVFRNHIVGQSIASNIEELMMTYDFLKKLYEIKNPEKISLEYEFKYSEGVFKIKCFKFKIGDVIVSNVDLEKNNEAKLAFFSDLIDFTKINQKHLTELKKAFRNNKTVFSFIQAYDFNEQNTSVVSYYYINFINRVISKLTESFSSQQINYVSPLRAHPKRYYFLDKAKVNSFLDTLDGEAIAETLKDDSTLKNSVNNWFKKFNLHIDVGPIKDIIHQIVVKQNALDLDITDVGFGVSQVLPVIIQGFLSKENSITLIEQPEIHLHPKMQADLADLFIDITLKKNTKKGTFIPSKYLIIETHSEYLLKRLRRRISEGKISIDEVALYYIEPQEETKSATIKKIDVNQKGAFDWPKDFYTGDLADDVTEFLKNQI